MKSTTNGPTILLRKNRVLRRDQNIISSYLRKRYIHVRDNEFHLAILEDHSKMYTLCTLIKDI